MLKDNRYLRIYVLVWIFISYPFMKLHSQNLVVEDTTISSGQHLFFSPGTITSPDSPTRPVLITGNAQVEYKAGQSIHLKCGFSTSLGSGGGSFHAYIANQGAVLNIKALIQGYYIGGGQMTPALYNEIIPGATDAMVDTVTIEARDATDFSLVDSYKGVIDTGGNVSGIFSVASIGTSYYIAIRHRNALFTCSANPVLLQALTSYDFRLRADSAFGVPYFPGFPYEQQYNFGDGYFGLYSGDVNGDEYIDTGDVTPIDNDNLSGLYSPGGYWISDINGDGYVDTGDVTSVDNNNLAGIFSQHP